MRVRDFLALVREELSDLLPPELRDFQWKTAFNLLQVYYWYAAVHYELWPQRKTGRVELGLHFEGEQEHNYRWTAALASRMGEVQAALGPQVEVEEWTQWWTRLHYTIDYQPLDEAFAKECARGLARMIKVLQPLLQELREEAGITGSRLTGPPRRRPHARRPLLR
ncbi:MAG: hypothetical protein HYS09_01560 [Chloroflexi bacterium]|nr:hypothetical protein [Chloroflexota bacterium]